LHWAQAKIYGHLLCQARGLNTITLSLVYFDVASLNETPLSEAFEAAALQAYFETICARFLVWARQELPTAARVTRLSIRWPSRTPAFARGSANWPRRCTPPAARAAA
jgi:DNA excision repair protein ERCC-2